LARNERGTTDVTRRRSKSGPDDRELDRLIEEAIVDAHNEWEQSTGLFTMLGEHLALPFTTRLLGQEVVVESIDLDELEIIALCRRGRERQRIRLLDLPLPTPAPAGAEWIAAYRRWARHNLE